MAFERKELNENLINGGEKYENGDSLQPTAVNEIVGAVLNLQENGGGGKRYRHTVEITSRDINHTSNYCITYIEYNDKPDAYTEQNFTPIFGVPCVFFSFEDEQIIGCGGFVPYDGSDYSYIFSGSISDGTACLLITFNPNYETIDSFNDNVEEI